MGSMETITVSKVAPFWPPVIRFPASRRRSEIRPAMRADQRGPPLYVGRGDLKLGSRPLEIGFILNLGERDSVELFKSAAG